MYYNFGVDLSKSELWLVVILSESFTELYDLLGCLLTNEKRDKFIRKVIDMSKDTFILHEWEKEKMDRLKELARLEDAKTEGHAIGFEQGIEEGFEQGIEQGIEQQKIAIAKNMLENNIPLDMISRCTELSVDVINNIN